MKTESIFWSKNFEIYKYHYETYGETGIIEEGETKSQARYRLKVNVHEALHEDHPHLKEVYPIPIVQKKEVAQPILNAIDKDSYKGLTEMTTMKGLKAYFKPADKVITIQKGAALVECINNCTSLEKLQSYEKDLDTTEAEIAYNDKFIELGNKEADFRYPAAIPYT